MQVKWVLKMKLYLILFTQRINSYSTITENYFTIKQNSNYFNIKFKLTRNTEYIIPFTIIVN